MHAGHAHAHTVTRPHGEELLRRPAPRVKSQSLRLRHRDRRRVGQLEPETRSARHRGRWQGGAFELVQRRAARRNRDRGASARQRTRNIEARRRRNQHNRVDSAEREGERDGRKEQGRLSHRLRPVRHAGVSWRSSAICRQL